MDSIDKLDKLQAKLDRYLTENNVYRIERKILLHVIKEQAQTIIDLTRQLQAKKGD